jgi:hypothetical protein
VSIALLHSPLVGPAIWSVLAPALQARGHDVVVPDLRPALREGAPYYANLAAVIGAVVDPNTVAVVHSGAGALVPMLGPLRGAVFIDALLPHPGESWFAGVPPELGGRLRGLAKNGTLPPWHAWWPKGAMERLLPDRALGSAFLGELEELPLGYFEELAPAVPLAVPGAYLQLSDAYAADADSAEESGWPVLRLKLQHLAVLTHPIVVADALEILLGTL